MNNLIEKLQDKSYVRAFGLLSAEEQECFRKAGKENCIIYGTGSEWEQAFSRNPFADSETYAIKLDYRPEPQFVDLEIVKGSDGYLGVYNTSVTKQKHPFVHLHCLLSLPNFHCFFCNDETAGECEINTTWVSRERRAGKKVYARLRSP